MASYLYHCAPPRIMMKFASVPVVLSESRDQPGASRSKQEQAGASRSKHAYDSSFRKPLSRRYKII